MLWGSLKLISQCQLGKFKQNQVSLFKVLWGELQKVPLVSLLS